MATSKTALKAYFETGDQPTETQFGELVDAMRHVDEVLAIKFATGIRFKKSGNVNAAADETGDFRMRMNSSGQLVIEYYNGASYAVASEFDAP
jgi:hypothetical protein